MKDLTKGMYESPTIVVIEINIEKGFATSGDGEPGHWADYTY